MQFAFGDVAQLGERSVRNAEAEGSNPFISTMKSEGPCMSADLFYTGTRPLDEGASHGQRSNPPKR